MSQAEAKLRPEKNSDEKFLRSLYATTRPDVTFNTLPQQQKDEFLRMQFDAQRLHYRKYFPQAEFLVIELNGQRIGRLYVGRVDNEFRLIDLSLVPKFRGQGIGTQIIRSLQSDAASQGLAMTLHAEKGKAVEFYQNLGFEIVTEKVAHFFMKWTANSIVLT